MISGLETGFRLDERFHWMTTGIERSKKPDLLALARVLAAAGVPYALIGGLALQVHRRQPRTTLDIDVAVKHRSAIPNGALRAAGFEERGRFEHSQNWQGPGGTPVQFSDDAPLAAAIDRAEAIDLEGHRVPVIRPADLLHAKLRAAADPARRRSKRLMDFADAEALLEDQPDLATELTATERALLDGLPR